MSLSFCDAYAMSDNMVTKEVVTAKSCDRTERKAKQNLIDTMLAEDEAG